MLNFIKWCFDTGSPDWVQFLAVSMAVIGAFILSVSYVTFTIATGNIFMAVSPFIISFAVLWYTYQKDNPDE